MFHVFENIFVFLKKYSSLYLPIVLNSSTKTYWKISKAGFKFVFNIEGEKYQLSDFLTATAAAELNKFKTNNETFLTWKTAAFYLNKIKPKTLFYILCCVTISNWENLVHALHLTTNAVLKPSSCWRLKVNFVSFCHKNAANTSKSKYSFAAFCRLVE